MVGCEENGERDEEEVGAQGTELALCEGQSEGRIAELPFKAFGANEFRL